MLLTQITAAKNEVAVSYHKVRGLYFPAAAFAVTIRPNIYLDKLYCFICEDNLGISVICIVD